MTGNKTSSNSFKQEVNLLDKPIWKIAEHMDKRTLQTNEIVINTEHGEFILRYNFNRTPDHTNMRIFYYLFMICQKTNTSKVSQTRYQILSSCNLSLNKDNYEKITETARIFTGMQIEANNCWYADKKYTTMIFTIMNAFDYDEKTNLVNFELNNRFLGILAQSVFIQYINFDEYKKLKKPIAARLYELLKTKLVANNEWRIECFKLAEKLTLDYLKYNSPSIIIRNVKIGVDEINKKTSFKIMFDVIKSEIDKKVKIIVFKILKRI